MKLLIVSPEQTLFEGEVELVELPGTKGRFTVLRDHDAIITTLQSGEIRYVVSGEERRQPVAGGYAEVKSNVVSACITLPAEG
jgi:F-type H+-transporting ATPase subunit epsilon